ncbi:hypothetical protein QJQ45_009762 [Haematococcus lacustris]|nr:hypothetical protein QJQ45_009762 [Haematococcus lacustris]
MSEGIDTDTVKARLTQALDAIECVGCLHHGSFAFEVSVVSAAFEGKSLLQRHRLVNDALRAEMPKIHALSVKRAVTPSQATTQASQADQHRILCCASASKADEPASKSHSTCPAIASVSQLLLYVQSPTQAGSSSGASSDGENIAALPVSQEKGKLRGPGLDLLLQLHML